MDASVNDTADDRSPFRVKPGTLIVKAVHGQRLNRSQFSLAFANAQGLAGSGFARCFRQI